MKAGQKDVAGLIQPERHFLYRHLFFLMFIWALINNSDLSQIMQSYDPLVLDPVKCYK